MNRWKWLWCAWAVLSVSIANAECLITKGALEIGSGSTKAYAAVVDTCKKQIQKVLFDQQIQVSFAEDLSRSSKKQFSEEFVQKSLPEIEKLFQEMKKASKAKVYYAVATAAFRQASNGKEVAAQISKRLEVPTEIISQDREAELGFQSALVGKKDPSKWVVWDIGGSSMQMIAPPEKKVPVFKGSMASVSFQKKVITDIWRKDLATTSTPNPLGERAKVAVHLAKTIAKIETPATFKKAVKESQVLGIGGVLATSVQNQVNPGKSEFTAAQIEKVIREKSTLTDAELKSAYAPTEVTNLALVLGYMKALEIQSVTTAKGNLGPGILLSFN